MNFLKSKYLGGKSLIFIFFGVTILVMVSTLIEISVSRENMFSLLESQSHTLMETVIIASRNSILSSEKFEEYISEKLLDNAGFIKSAYEEGRVTEDYLNIVAESHGIFRINIFDKRGVRIFSNRGGSGGGQGSGRPELLAPVFNGEQDTLIIGLKEARFSQGYRYVAAMRAKNGSVIVINLDASELIRYRKETGFGALIRELSTHEGIIYSVLQDEEGILAGSGEIDFLEDISNEKFLVQSAADSTFSWRILENKGEELFEAVHPFFMGDDFIGLLRLGVSLKPLNEMNDRIYRRSIILGVLLVLSGSILISYIFNQQNYTNLKREYESVEAKAASILSNISDAVFIVDNDLVIHEKNNAGEFYTEKSGKFLIELENKIRENLYSDESVFSFEVKIRNLQKYLLVTKSGFTAKGGNAKIILLISDFTRLRELEANIEKTERQRAMGELAAGVAHEIRNPLNSIGVVVQHLGRDFEVKENPEEFRELTDLVYDEVKRINATISEFLQFVKPGVYNKTEFNLSWLKTKMELQYKNLFEDSGIRFNVFLKEDLTVYWDKEKMFQVLVNLLANSSQAIVEADGQIDVRIYCENENVILEVEDNGSGIKKENLPKIFNLYFTTKAEGTGIGLGVVQKIVYEHGGVISVVSELQKQTIFTLKIPVRYIDRQT